MTVIPDFVHMSEVGQLTWREDLWITLAAALIVHLVFKRWEPIKLRVVVPLLVFLPGLLSVLYIQHFGVVKGVGLAFSAYYAILCSSIVMYRLSPWHPLARYPGPILAKVSKFYMVHIVRRPEPWKWVHVQHEKYGDVVRIGPNEVSIRDASVVQPMLGSQGMPKGPSWIGRSVYPKVLSLVATGDPTEHAQRRRPWSRACMPAALKEYEPHLKKRSAQLVEILGKQEGVVELSEWIHRFSYDFMGDMVFGGGTELLAEGDSKGLLGGLKRGMSPITTLFDQVPWLAYYSKKIPSIEKRYLALRIGAFKRAEERYQRGSTTKDIFYYLSNEDGSEKVPPPREVVVADGQLGVVAGSDTTASTLTVMFSLFLRYPEVYKRLQAEVDKFYPPGEDSLDPKYHQDMPYLEAVINETLRLYPAGPSGSQRCSERGSGGRAIGPYFIPEGNNTRLHTYSVQRDARYFSYPETFWPDRWLIAAGLQESTEKITHDPLAFVPFSFGPMNCVGKQLALKNMRMVLCHLTQKLEMRLPEGMTAKDVEKNIVYTRGELPVVIKRRD